MRQSLISVPNFFGSWIQSCTKTRWDTCSTNHHYVHNQDVCVQNDMYDSISMF